MGNQVNAMISSARYYDRSAWSNVVFPSHTMKKHHLLLLSNIVGQWEEFWILKCSDGCISIVQCFWLHLYGVSWLHTLAAGLSLHCNLFLEVCRHQNKDEGCSILYHQVFFPALHRLRSISCTSFSRASLSTTDYCWSKQEFGVFRWKLSFWSSHIIQELPHWVLISLTDAWKQLTVLNK